MRKTLQFAALCAGTFLAASPCFARAAGGIHSAPARAAPVNRSAPVARSMPSRVPVPQHVARPGAPTVHQPVHRELLGANPVRHAPERFVRFHGGMIGIPPLIALPEPVFLDVPDLGEVIVPHETYVAVYPLLTSDSEADHEKAFSLLKEQVERDPQSLQRSNPVVVAAPQARRPYTCPDCKDGAQILLACRPVGNCDQSELLVGSAQKPAHLAPARPADPQKPVN
ncbi:hypothetical protein [Bradyrhizobium jicamae]|uniref:hypothetical protein n=1 Tax=Bradyrhizobium jicamae TaxID=280332 RepID=UPI001BA7724B|nr:hypothetical protein [Bradyrhizobium jicamae]MBR0937351.1 hypothetical protein [Bradyrhizobium jicamae]